MLNPETAKAMTIHELASALDEQMCEFGYAESSLKTYRSICVKSEESRSAVNIISTVISVALVLMMVGIVALALVLNFLQ